MSTSDRHEQRLNRAAEGVARQLLSEREAAVKLLVEMGVPYHRAEPLVSKLQLSAATRAYDAAASVIRGEV